MVLTGHRYSTSLGSSTGAYLLETAVARVDPSMILRDE
jgi:hypothetical protein